MVDASVEPVDFTDTVPPLTSEGVSLEEAEDFSGTVPVLGAREEFDQSVEVEDAGSFFDMFADGLTPGQTNYLEKTGVSAEDFFRSKMSRGVSLPKPVEDLLGLESESPLPSGFNEDEFLSLSEGPSATEAENSRREKVLRNTGFYEQGRLDLDSTTLTIGQIYDLNRAGSEEEKLEKLKELYGDGASLQPVVVGVDSEGNDIKEFLYSRTPADKLRRLEPYGSFTGIQGIAKDWARKDVDPKARIRLEDISKRFLGTALDEVTSLEYFLPALALAAAPIAGMGLLIQTGVAGGRAIAAGSLNLIGQTFDRAIAGYDPSKLQNLDALSATLDAALFGFGPLAMNTLKWFGGDRSPISKAYDLAGGQNALAFLNRVERVAPGASIPRAFLFNKGLARSFVDQVFSFNPEKVKKAIAPLAKDIFLNLSNQARKAGNLTNVGVGTLLRLTAESEQRAKKLMNDYLAGFASQRGTLDMGLGPKAAELALKGLDGLFQNMTAVKDALFHEALKSPKVVDAIYDNMDMTGLKQLSQDALRKVVSETKRQVGGEEAAEKSYQVINPPPENIRSILERILNLPDKLEEAAIDPLNQGKKSSVILQLHTLKQELSQASDNLGSDAAFVKPLRQRLDDLIDKAGDIVVRDGGKTAADLYRTAQALSLKQANLKRSNYISNALANKDTEPFMALMDPFIQGDTAIRADSLNLMNSVIDTQWTELVKLPELKRFFPRENYTSVAQAKKDFRIGLRDSAFAFLGKEPSAIGANLLALTGARSLGSRETILNDESFKFLVPNQTERTKLLLTAQRIDKEQKTTEIYKSAYNNLFDIEPNSNAMSRDVSRALMTELRSRALEDGSPTSLLTTGKIEKIFDAIGRTKGGVDRIVPQLQRYYVENILKSFQTGIKKGDITLDLKLFDTRVQSLDPFDRQVMDYITSKGTGLNGLKDIPQLFDDIKEISGVLGNLSSGDFAAGLATGAQAGKLLGSQKVKNLMGFIYRTLENKALISALLKPMNRKSIMSAISESSPLSSASKKRLVLQMLIREEENLSREPEYGVSKEFLSLDDLVNVKNPNALPPAIRSEVIDKVKARLKSGGIKEGKTGVVEENSVIQKVRDLQGGQAEDTLEVMPTRPPQIQRILSTPSAPAPLSSLNIPATNPVPGGIASLAGLEKVGLGLWT